jgi:hypothetical protein
MTSFRTKALGACAILGIAAASGASAGTLEITGAGIYSTNQLDVNGVNEYATALDLTVQGSANPLFVFCVDLSHVIYVNIGSQLAYNPPLQYATGPVNTNSSGAASGTGALLLQSVSGEIQTLANLGVGIAKNGGAPTSWSANTQNELTAVQGAIWETEYGFTPSQVIGTPDQNALIAAYVAYADAHPAADYATGIYPTGAGGQGFGFSQGQVTGVPEPSTWAMLLLGFAGLAVGGYRRAKSGGAAIAVG